MHTNAYVGVLNCASRRWRDSWTCKCLAGRTSVLSQHYKSGTFGAGPQQTITGMGLLHEVCKRVSRLRRCHSTMSINTRITHSTDQCSCHCCDVIGWHCRLYWLYGVESSCIVYPVYSTTPLHDYLEVMDFYANQYCSFVLHSVLVFTHGF